MVQPRPGLGYAMVASAATLFAVNGTVSKVILGSGISSGQLTAVRCAGALIGLGLIAAATRPRSLRVRTGDLPLLVALGIGLAVVQWAYFFAIHRLDIGIALLIQYIAPLLVALWARFVFTSPSAGASGQPSPSRLQGSRSSSRSGTAADSAGPALRLASWRQSATRVTC